ncbi:MAG TPA: cyclic nucleotide-binding domain-containing protein [Myxococcales bacterium]|nr:cyclic nucleotide-binding domain-containing protein [Myxococcales bacterium]
MLLGFVARSTPVHQAKTAAEREAIYKLRYSIYGKELRRDYPGMDHAQGLLKQAADETPEARLYYTGPAEAPTGTGRARVWDEPPHEIVEEFSLQSFPKARVAVLERLMVKPTLRGRLLLPALLWHGYEYMMKESVDLCVLTCVPGLLRHYLKLGARPYGAKLVEGASATEVPLLISMHDHAHSKRMGSFMYPQLKRLAKKSFDLKPLEPLFAPEAQPLVVDAKLIVQELQLTRPPLFEGAAESTLRLLAERAFIMSVEQGEMVVRKGTADREMYLVLSGELEVEGRNVRIKAGEPVGEIGFLGTPGVRTATVRAARTSRLLVLRRKFLDDLAEKDAPAAYKLSRNLSRALADRFAEAHAKAAE